MYYGDEIGLENVPIPPERVQDPWEKNEPGLGFGRDPYRTPMQWSAERSVGFSDGEPWLPLTLDYATRNVEALRGETRSILTLYRRLIALRREHLALSVGTYAAGGTQGNLFWFERRHGDTRLMVVLNFGHDMETLALPDDAAKARVLLSTLLDRDNEEAGREVTLRGDEGIILAT
jgi:alpha-glucosidase